MKRPRRFALLAASSLGLFLGATGPAHAQEASPPPPRFPGIPLGPVLPGESLRAPPVFTVAPPPGWVLVPDAPPPPPSLAPAPKSEWYGWQILVPTLVLDTIMIGSFVAGQSTGSSAGSAVAVAALVSRGVTGPIIHLVHHQPLKALGSLALEGALPAIFIAGAFAPQCDFCSGPILSLVLGLPIALTAGTAIDVGALSYEAGPAKLRDDAPADPASRWSVAPLVLPPLHAGAAHAGPAPVGAAMVGTF